MTATEERPTMIVTRMMEWEGIGSAAHNNKSFLIIYYYYYCLLLFCYYNDHDIV
jgi:hypothetical protein